VSSEKIPARPRRIYAALGYENYGIESEEAVSVST
jgi:hypothetical protein